VRAGRSVTERQSQSDTGQRQCDRGSDHAQLGRSRGEGDRDSRRRAGRPTLYPHGKSRIGANRRVGGGWRDVLSAGRQRAAIRSLPITPWLQRWFTCRRAAPKRCASADDRGLGPTACGPCY
jgi:hypothetical protein